MICEFEFKKAIHDELGDDWFSDSDVAHAGVDKIKFSHKEISFNLQLPEDYDDKQSEDLTRKAQIQK